MQTSPTVLIVDDNPLVRESYHDLLHAEGFAPAEAGNGAEAILWFQRGTADLILLDLKMPVLDGRGFLEYRLRNPKIREIPVLVVSSLLDDAGLRQILLDFGADRVLQKPVLCMELVNAMRELLAKPSRPDVPPPREAQKPGGRQDARLSFTVPIRVRTRSSLGTSGTLRDLSAGGLGVYLSLQLELREPITVSLDIDGRSLALAGTVQWVSERLAARGFPHGIRFAEKQEDSFPLHTYSFFRPHSQATS